MSQDIPTAFLQFINTKPSCCRRVHRYNTTTRETAYFTGTEYISCRFKSCPHRASGPRPTELVEGWTPVDPAFPEDPAASQANCVGLIHAFDTIRLQDCHVSSAEFVKCYFEHICPHRWSQRHVQWDASDRYCHPSEEDGDYIVAHYKPASSTNPRSPTTPATRPPLATPPATADPLPPPPAEPPTPTPKTGVTTRSQSKKQANPLPDQTTSVQPSGSSAATPPPPRASTTGAEPSAHRPTESRPNPRPRLPTTPVVPPAASAACIIFASSTKSVKWGTHGFAFCVDASSSTVHPGTTSKSDSSGPADTSYCATTAMSTNGRNI